MDSTTAFDQSIAGVGVPGAAGVALDTSGTPTFGGRGILRFAPVGDVDGDGKDDIAAGSLWAKARDDVSIGNFTIFSNLDTADASFTVQPAAVFQAAAIDQLLEGFNFSSLGDFDGDGREEILVGRDPRVGGRTDTGAHTLHEIGNGVTVGHRIASSGGSETNFIGDVNGDGFDDIFLTGPDGVSHSILFGNPEGALSIDLGIDGSGEIAVHQRGRAVSGNADLNGDGIGDFAVLDRGESSVSIFFGSADIASGAALVLDTPGSGFRLQLPDTPQSVELLSDFNGDGLGDLLVSRRGGAEIIFGSDDLSGARGLTTFAGDDALRIELSGPNSIALGIGDLNGDGLSDINFSTRNAEGGTDVGVVFGAAGLSGTIGLGDLDGSNGFVVTGASAGQSAGDTNGDGVGDLMLRVGSGGSGASFMAIIHGREVPETVLVGEPEPEPPGAEPIVIPPPPPPSGNPLPGPQPPPHHSPAPPPDQPETEDDVTPGTELPDIIHGSPEADSVDAAGGNDRIFGATGDDTLFGGAGNDHLVGGPGKDLLSGNDGNDRILGEDDDDALFGGLGDDAMRGHAGDDLLDGGAGDDSLNGGDGQDELRGGDGRDLLRGGAGDDSLFGGLGEDALLGDGGDDLISGGDGRDILKGGRGSDTLDGGGGNDRISGGIGDDELAGGRGNDFLTGGAGGDRFVMELGGGQDEILDFNAVEGDRLDFTRLGVELQSAAVNELSGNIVIDVADIRVVLAAMNRADFDLEAAAIF